MEFKKINYGMIYAMVVLVGNVSVIQASGFEDLAGMPSVTLERVVNSYPKFEVVKDYLLTQLSAKAEVLQKQPSAKEFIAIYDAMPKDLQRELNHMYLTMPISAQNEAIEQLGYNADQLHALIADQIAQRAVKRAQKEVNKLGKNLQAWWNSK